MLINRLEKKILLEEFYNKFFNRVSYCNVFALIDNGSICYIKNLMRSKEKNNLILKKIFNRTKPFLKKSTTDYIEKKTLKIRDLNEVASYFRFGKNQNIRQFTSIVCIYRSTYIGLFNSDLVLCTYSIFEEIFYFMLENLFSLKYFKPLYGNNVRSNNSTTNFSTKILNIIKTLKVYSRKLTYKNVSLPAYAEESFDDEVIHDEDFKEFNLDLESQCFTNACIYKKTTKFVTPDHGAARSLLLALDEK